MARPQWACILTTLCCYLHVVSPRLFADAYINRTAIDGAIDDIRRLNAVSAPCITQVVKFLVDLSDQKSWPFRFIDSFGKPEAGAFNGNLMWMGDYEQCRSIRVDGDWSGKYCHMAPTLDMSDRDDDGELLGFTLFGQPVVTFGFCAPDKCDKTDIVHLINYMIEHRPQSIMAYYEHLPGLRLIKINQNLVSCQEEKFLDQKAIVILSVLGSFVCLVLAATLVDLCSRWWSSVVTPSSLKLTNISAIGDNGVASHNDDDDEDDKMKEIRFASQLLANFSVVSNTAKLFTHNPNDIKCLHGIRFLTLAWVNLHNFYLFMGSHFDNEVTYQRHLNTLGFMIVTNGFYCVDTFFLLSGMLSQTMLAKRLANRKIHLAWHVIGYYLHRLWRITPVYAIVLVFSIGVSKYLGSGPFYNEQGFESDRCAREWWKNLLYINNVASGECLAISWYLACDMQFHLVAPICVIPFAYGARLTSLIVCGCILVANMASILTIIVIYPDTLRGIYSSENFGSIYLKPWTRIGPFVVGIVFSFYFHQLKKHFDRAKTSARAFKLVDAAMWLVAIMLIIGIVYGIYPLYAGHSVSNLFVIVYQTTSRFLWALAVSYMIFSCVVTDSLVNKILSSKIWLPLSKLSFSAFIVHQTVIAYFINILEKPIHMQKLHMVYLYCGNMILSLTVGYVVHVLFEAPIAGLERLFTNSQRSEKTSE